MRSRTLITCRATTTRWSLFGDPDELRGDLEAEIGEQPAPLIEQFERGRMSGLHLNAFTRQPFALVAAADDAGGRRVSHEVLEMLADPFGNRLIAAAHPTRPDLRVQVPARGLRSLPVDLVPGERRAGLGLLHASLLRSGPSTPRATASRAPSSARSTSSTAATVTWIDPAESALYQWQGPGTEPFVIADFAQLARTNVPLRTLVDSNPASPRITAASLRPAGSAAAAFDAGRPYSTRRGAPRGARPRRSSRWRRGPGDIWPTHAEGSAGSARPCRWSPRACPATMPLRLNRAASVVPKVFHALVLIAIGGLLAAPA